MRCIFFLVTVLMLCSALLHAQKHDYIWMAGIHIPSDSLSSDFTVDFNTFPPTFKKIPDSLYMGITSIAISNSEGALEFYTNGCIVRTKNHTTMEGGSFINGGPENTAWDASCGPQGFGAYRLFQGVFALPYENGTQELFHIRFQFVPPAPSTTCTNEALLLSRIDMNANQDLGKVVFKDSVLVEGCLQTACANRHANGRDWWVLLPDNVHHRFYRFLSTPNGLQGPWIQEIAHPTTADSFYYVGWNEFSPNGEHLLINDIQTGTAIYDFDRCTGLLSNLRFIPADIDLNGYGYAAVFSPDSRLIYVVRGNFRTLEQYDLHAADLIGSRTPIATWDGYYDYIEPSGPFAESNFSFFQHGPDGKHYLWAGGTKFMHLMDFPNRKGMDCKFRQRAIELPYYGFGANAYYPNYRLGPIDGSSCDSLGIDNLPVALFRYDTEDTLSPLQQTFTDLSYYEPDTWFWDFGDGTQSQEKDPVHSFPAPGTYTVCLTASNANASDTYCRQVTVGTVGIETLPVLPHVQVSPNPFSGELRVQLPALVGVSPRFVLYDLYGREVHTAWLRDFDTYISLSQLHAGMYVWQLRWNGVATQSGRVVKILF